MVWWQNGHLKHQKPNNCKIYDSVPYPHATKWLIQIWWIFECGFCDRHAVSQLALRALLTGLALADWPGRDGRRREGLGSRSPSNIRDVNRHTKEFTVYPSHKRLQLSEILSNSLSSLYAWKPYPRVAWICNQAALKQRYMSLPWFRLNVRNQNHIEYRIMMESCICGAFANLNQYMWNLVNHKSKSMSISHIQPYIFPHVFHLVSAMKGQIPDCQGSFASKCKWNDFNTRPIFKVTKWSLGTKRRAHVKTLLIHGIVQMDIYKKYI